MGVRPKGALETTSVLITFELRKGKMPGDPHPGIAKVGLWAPLLDPLPTKCSQSASPRYRSPWSHRLGLSPRKLLHSNHI